MTDEKINELATQFVDELFKDDDMSDQENIEDKNDALVMCMAFAGHILEKHCIVPKATLDKHYTEMAKDYAMHLDPESKPNREMIEVDSLGFLNWVMAKYCIVEKSKVKQEYEHNSEMYDLGCVVPATMGHVHKGKMELLESLFGKELFNVTEK